MAGTVVQLAPAAAFVVADLRLPPRRRPAERTVRRAEARAGRPPRRRGAPGSGRWHARADRSEPARRRSPGGDPGRPRYARPARAPPKSARSRSDRPAVSPRGIRWVRDHGSVNDSGRAIDGLAGAAPPSRCSLARTWPARRPGGRPSGPGARSRARSGPSPSSKAPPCTNSSVPIGPGSWPRTRPLGSATRWPARRPGRRWHPGPCGRWWRSRGRGGRRRGNRVGSTRGPSAVSMMQAGAVEPDHRPPGAVDHAEPPGVAQAHHLVARAQSDRSSVRRTSAPSTPCARSVGPGHVR